MTAFSPTTAARPWKFCSVVKFVGVVAFCALATAGATALTAQTRRSEYTPDTHRRITLIQDALDADPLVVFEDVTGGAELKLILLKALGRHYDRIVKHHSAKQHQATLEQHFTGFKEMPQVFLEGAFIGTTADIQRMNDKGMLLRMVEHIKRREEMKLETQIKKEV